MITSICGNNAYAINLKLSDLKNNFIKKNGAINLEKFDGEEDTYEQVIDSVTNTSLFSDQKLIVLENLDKNNDIAEKIEDLLTRTDGSDLVLVVRSIDKRSKLYKTLKNKTDFLEFNIDNNISLDKWVGDEVAKRGGSIDQQSTRFLIEKTGNQQLKLSNEIDKLLAYQPSITKSIIDLLTVNSPQSTVFQLLDAAFSGDYSRTLAIYEEQRAQKVEPIAILGMIIWQLHIFAIIKFAENKSSSDIAKQAKLNPYVVDKSRQALRRISKSYLKKLINQVAELDVSLKSESIDSDNALKNLLLDISEAVS